MTDLHRLGSRYILHEVIGRGAMGEVWRASVEDDGSPVAVKVLRSDLSGDPLMVGRFLQERSVLTDLDHPHLVRVRDLVVEGDTIGIVMDLVEGHDLRAELRRRRSIVAAEACRLMAGVCSAVAFAHDRGVIHRDVKPENILLDCSGLAMQARLTDFGIARIAHGPSFTRTTGILGTLEYMAPELSERGNASPASDIYAAGIVLYELLTGATPFGGGHPGAVLRRHLDEEPGHPVDLDEQLWQLIATMLAKRPEARPASAHDVVAVLASASERLRLDASSPAPGVAVSSGRVPSTAPDENPLADSADLALAGEPDVNSTRLGIRRPPPQPEPPTATANVAARRRRRAERPASRPRTKARSPLAFKWKAVAGVTAVLLLALLIVARGRGPADPSVAIETEPLAFAFDPIAATRDVIVEREWVVDGDGRLNGRITVRNSSAAPLDGKIDEYFPTALVRKLSDVAVSPPPDEQNVADRSVTWVVHGLAPGERMTISYLLTPRQALRSRDDLTFAAGLRDIQEERARERRQAASTLESLALEPDAVQLMVGESASLFVSGRTATGAVAHGSLLAGTSWSVVDAGVAAVDRTGRVTAISPGETVVRVANGPVVGEVSIAVSAPPTTAVLPPVTTRPAPSRPTPRPPTVTVAPVPQPPVTAAPAPAPTIPPAPVTTETPRTTRPPSATIPPVPD